MIYTASMRPFILRFRTSTILNSGAFIVKNCCSAACAWKTSRFSSRMLTRTLYTFGIRRFHLQTKMVFLNITEIVIKISAFLPSIHDHSARSDHGYTAIYCQNAFYSLATRPQFRDICPVHLPQLPIYESGHLYHGTIFISHYPTLLVANIRSHNLTRFFVFIAHKNQQYLYFVFCLLLYSIFKLLFLSHKQLFLNLVFHLTSRTMFPNYALIMIQYIYTSFILPDSIDKAYLYRHHVLTGFVLFYLHTVHSAET